MVNIQIDITVEGKTTLATAGKYCDRNIDVNVSVPGGIGVVPDYWKSYLNAKTTEINTALTAAGDNKSAFLWYTDAHWPINYGMSPVILKYLNKNTSMAKTFYGGDISNEKSGEIETLTEWQSLVSGIPNHHSVIGNHDNQVTELESAEARGDFFLDRTGDMVMGTDATNGNNYYYIDNHIEKTRYICLSTGRMWVYAAEMEWCVEALETTPKNWHIVVISHLWLDTSSGSIVPTPPDYSQSFLDMFDAYNYRGSGTTSVNSVSYDFVNGEAKIEFVIGGHVHVDYDFATAKGIPVILTECDCWEERGASTATKGTTTESCVYAIVADYAAKKVNVINVGRGSTRSIAIPDVVRYTNWAKVATDASGNVYEGTDVNGNTIYGYSENKRFSSSQQETTVSNWDITGFIPVRLGSVLRFRNMTYMDIEETGGTSRQQNLFYKEDYSYKTTATGHKPSALPTSAWSPVYGENGDVIQLTIPSTLGSDIRFVRMCVRDLREDSIITVDEEIA